MSDSDNTRLVIVLEAQSRKLQNSLVDVNKQIDRFAQATERRFAQMQQKSNASFAKLSSELRTSVGGLNGILAPLTAALSVREVVTYSDAWQTAKNKIAAAATVAGLVPRSLDTLKTSANGARTDLESYVDLYSRLLRVAPSVAASEEDIARATDLVAKALKAGGASAQEQAATLTQLGQALGSGALQGDELRSLRENAPLVAAAIAKAFGTTIGGLKALGAAGKLEITKVFRGILAGGEDIEKAFAATRSTINDAFTVINNDFTAYVGTAGQASGATQALIDSLVYLADHFKQVGDAVIIFATILATALAGKAIAGVIVGIVQATVALATFLAAMSSGTLTVAVFSAAMGPIALIAAAAAVAFALVAYQQGEAGRAAIAHASALDTNAAALDVAKDASDKFRKSLKSSIETQIVSARAALEDAKAQTAAARAHLLFEMTVANAKHGLKTDPGAADDAPVFGSSAMLDENKKFLDKLEKQLAELNALGEGGPGSSPLDTPGGGDKKYESKIKSVIDQTNALIAQTNAMKTLNPLVNDYGYALAFAKVKQELLTAATDAGVAKTPELVRTIDFLAEGYAKASAEAAKLAETQDDARQKMDDFFAGMKDVSKSWIQDLIAGKSAAEALGNALSNIGNRLLDLGLDALFGTGKGDSPFGLLGKVFGLAKGGVVAHGKPKMFANGGVSNSAAVFGEAGPEAAVPLPDGRRIPVDLRAPKGGSSGAVSVTYAPHIDARGADQAAVDRLERAVAKHAVNFEANVIGTIRRAKGRGVKL